MATEQTFTVIIKELPDDTEAEDTSAEVLNLLNAGLASPAYAFSAILVQ